MEEMGLSDADVFGALENPTRVVQSGMRPDALVYHDGRLAVVAVSDGTVVTVLWDSTGPHYWSREAEA